MTDAPSKSPTPAPQPEPKRESTEAKPAPKPGLTERKRRLVRWLRRHHRILTFVGALIVFATFVAKEGLRDELKDVLSSLEAQEQNYVVRTDIESFRERVEHMSAVQLYATQYRSQAPMPMYLKFDEFSAAGARHKAVLDNASRLMRQLPPDLLSRHAEKAKELEKQLATFDHDAHVSFGMPDKPLQDLVEQLHDEDNRLRTVTRNFAQAVMASAEEYGTREVRKYHVYTLISVLLYVFGWGLGLAGRLVGVEGLGDGDD